MTLLAASQWALLTLAGICLLLGALTVARRRWRRRADARAAAILEPLRPSLLDLVGGDEAEAEAALAVLARVSADDWPLVRDALVGFLGKFRGASLWPVVRALAARGALHEARRDLGARSAVRRGRGAHLLGLVRDRLSRPRLEALLADRDVDVRITAARALGRLGDGAAAESLLGALSGARAVAPGVVADAMLMLGAGTEPAVRSALASADTVARSVAADIAGLVGAITLTEPLCGTLALDPVPEVRARAAAALGRLGSPAALDPLVRALDDDASGVRLAAATALGALGDPAATPALAAHLAGGDLLAEICAQSLAQLGPSGRAALSERSDPAVPSAAAGALALADLRDRTPVSR